MNRKLEIYYSEDSVVNVYAKEKKYLKDNYARCFLNEITNIASDKELNGTDLRVLLGIIGHLQYENILNISQKKLGEIIKIPRQEITKSIKKLILKDYLQIIDKIGKQNIYKLNPKVAFKSRAKNYKDLCNDWKEDNSQFKENESNNPNENLQNKLDQKINEISNKFDIEKEKAKDILFLVLNEGLNTKDEKDLPY